MQFIYRVQAVGPWKLGRIKLIWIQRGQSEKPVFNRFQRKSCFRFWHGSAGLRATMTFYYLLWVSWRDTSMLKESVSFPFLWYRLGLTLVACRPPELLQGLRSLDQPTLDPENLLLTTRHVCKEIWDFPVKIMSKSATRPRTLPSRVDNKELHRETRTIIANFDQEHQEPLGRAKLDNDQNNHMWW